MRGEDQKGEERRNEEAAKSACDGGRSRCGCARRHGTAAKGNKKTKTNENKIVIVNSNSEGSNSTTPIVLLSYGTSSHVQLLLRLVPLLVGGCLSLVWFFVCSREGLPSLT